MQIWKMVNFYNLYQELNLRNVKIMSYIFLFILAKYLQISFKEMKIIKLLKLKFLLQNLTEKYISLLNLF